MTPPQEHSNVLETSKMPDGVECQEVPCQSDKPVDKSTDKVTVDIFVSQHCFVCEYSQEIAALIEQNFSDVQLRVIDINSEEDIPEAVFATPTYLLNGRVWSLGNPSPEQVTERLTELLANDCEKIQ